MGCPRQTSVNKFRHQWISLTHSAFVIGLVSLLWFAFRTGTKPSRAAYPCQKAAAASGYAWLAAYVIPFLPFAKVIKTKRLSRPMVWMSLSLLLFVGGGWLAANMEWGASGTRSANQAVALALPSNTAASETASDIFVVQNAPLETGGIPDLIEMMAAGGLSFYQSQLDAVAASPDGLIASNDIVLLKINCQWANRGGTNTDLLKALIQAIIDHPDGFRGEIVVADNGQLQYGSANNGGRFTWSQNNAEDRTQSVQNVVDAFAETHAVSTYLWDNITRTEVSEYDTGDMTDGYIVEQPMDARSESFVAYPKFQTSFGTYVSFKNGIWDPTEEAYDSDRLVLINVPVLKPHGIYGVTGCIKHYMGVTSDSLTRQLGARAHDTIVAGGMGTLISGSRLPDLNIMDALWVSLEPGKGPSVGYDQATCLQVIAASTDPVALDYWASKYILMQGAEQAGNSSRSFNPEMTGIFPRVFSKYLDSSKNILQEDGFQVTTDEDAMNVHIKIL